MSTTFEAVSPVCPSSTMASASAVSATSNSFVVGSSFHNLTNHVILSPNREDVNLNLSPSSSFRSNFSSACNSSSSSNPPKSVIPSNFATSASLSYSSDTKENTSCPVVSNPSMNQSSVQEVKEEVDDNDSTNVPIQSETEVTNTGEINDDAITIEKEEPKQLVDEVKVISMTEFDENSSNSNSTQSSENTSGSGRKKRRRGEGQILMADLIGIDKSLADDIANHLKSTSQPSNDPNSVDQNDLSNQTGDGEPKKSKEDSPAFRLRPRRSHKLSGSFSGYGSGSGSSSPVSFMFSPVKRNRQPLMKKSISNYTQQLLSDTSKQLSQFLNEGEPSHNESYTTASNQSSSFDSKDDLECSLTPNPPAPLMRQYSRSILRDVDVSVFAELITPLDLIHSNVYTTSYLALQIVDIKPLRYVSLQHPDTNDKLSSPLLELKVLDINDRFSLEHVKGIFDDSAFSQASNKYLKIFLLGTYALKSNELATKGQVVNIVRFRTTKLAKNASQPLQPPKKRKIVATIPSELTNDELVQSFPFDVIVDSLGDITAFSEDHKSNLHVKEEISDNGMIMSSPESDHFEELYHNSPRAGAACESNWLPLVSFSSKWRAPDDPRELNKSLYVLQPCIPKFESASRTVKM